jgi:hypothetical protein
LLAGGSATVISCNCKAKEPYTTVLHTPGCRVTLWERQPHSAVVRGNARRSLISHPNSGRTRNGETERKPQHGGRKPRPLSVVFLLPSPTSPRLGGSALPPRAGLLFNRVPPPLLRHSRIHQAPNHSLPLRSSHRHYHHHKQQLPEPVCFTLVAWSSRSLARCW